MLAETPSSYWSLSLLSQPVHLVILFDRTLSYVKLLYLTTFGLEYTCPSHTFLISVFLIKEFLD